MTIDSVLKFALRWVLSPINFLRGKRLAVKLVESRNRLVKRIGDVQGSCRYVKDALGRQLRELQSLERTIERTRSFHSIAELGLEPLLACELRTDRAEKNLADLLTYDDTVRGRLVGLRSMVETLIHLTQAIEPVTVRNGIVKEIQQCRDSLHDITRQKGLQETNYRLAIAESGLGKIRSRIERIDSAAKQLNVLKTEVDAIDPFAVAVDVSRRERFETLKLTLTQALKERDQGRYDIAERRIITIRLLKETVRSEIDKARRQTEEEIEMWMEHCKSSESFGNLYATKIEEFKGAKSGENIQRWRELRFEISKYSESKACATFESDLEFYLSARSYLRLQKKWAKIVDPELAKFSRAVVALTSKTEGAIDSVHE
jgi:hypothetical protein